MSSSQNLQPENADNAELEDISVPTFLEADTIFKIVADHYRLLIVPQKLQDPLFSKTHRTRGSERIIGKLKGFMDLPMDVVFEVSLRRTISKFKTSLPQCSSS
jgi:hypothetical protein